ncbi:MAG: hypothetical protein U5L08_08860 [Xanthomonadales bacterium]|nr:hypothetical protein [Xanthomonadales bacterium]
MIRIIFLVCALIALSSAHGAESEAQWLDKDSYTEVARWMIEQPDTEMRAAGLAVLAETGDSGSAIELDRFISEVESLLEDEPTGAAVFMVAQGCHQLDLIDECSRMGVPEAIDRLDGGNPMAAGLFHEPGSPEYRQVLITAESIDDHYPEAVSAWFEAFVARDPEGMEEGTELLMATSVALAYALPAIQNVVQSCKSAIGSDDELDGACQRLGQQMRESGRTMLLQNIGYGIARARAERVGNKALVERIRSEKEAMTHPAACLSQSATELLGTDLAAQRRFLAEMRARGEIQAFEMLVDQYGSSCDADEE